MKFSQILLPDCLYMYGENLRLIDFSISHKKNHNVEQRLRLRLLPFHTKSSFTFLIYNFFFSN